MELLTILGGKWNFDLTQKIYHVDLKILSLSRFYKIHSRRPGELVRDGGGDEAHQHHRANRGGNVQGDVGAGRNRLQNSSDHGPFRGPRDHGAAGVHPPGSWRHTSFVASCCYFVTSHKLRYVVLFTLWRNTSFVTSCC